MKTILSIYAAVVGCAAALVSANAATVHYVNVNNPTSSPPYTNWATAANIIQDAVDVSVDGDEIVVTNGVYQSGGAIVSGLSNRVAITKALTLRSVNGPLMTVIRGEHQSPARCVYLTNGAKLVGFTLTDGGTSRQGAWHPALQGGGAWCESQNAAISNCVVTGNTAALGGGVWGGTLHNCKLINNRADGTSGFIGSGGGAAYAVLNNCLVQKNFSLGFGGGAMASTLNNCTVVENSAWNEFIPGNRGSGTIASTLNDCIVYFNTEPVTSEPSNYVDCLINYSCTTPLPTNGIGNIADAPLFLDAAAGNFRLQSNSPCINAGRNAEAPTGLDLDGNRRIVGGTVDIGAYEFQSPGSTLSYAWLRQYGLPTDGSVDHLDPDHDGHSNWQEWRGGTDPTNSASALRLVTPTVSTNGLLIAWQSVDGRIYSLERSTNLLVFETIASNLTSVLNATTFADTNPPSFKTLFYRIRVEE